MSFMVKHLIKDIYEKELIRKAAELNLLQEQINPHFLYNVLSSISSMAMRSGNTEIMDMVEHLALFYRISLNKGKNILSVREEVNLLENYLQLQKVRFGEAIQVAYDLDEELMDCRIIKLILQPLVENAIHHAMKDETAILHIGITLRREQDHMLFIITDDGVGMEAETVEEINTEIRNAVRGLWPEKRVYPDSASVRAGLWGKSIQQGGGKEHKFISNCRLSESRRICNCNIFI